MTYKGKADWKTSHLNFESHFNKKQPIRRMASSVVCMIKPTVKTKQIETRSFLCVLCCTIKQMRLQHVKLTVLEFFQKLIISYVRCIQSFSHSFQEEHGVYAFLFYFRFAFSFSFSWQFRRTYCVWISLLLNKLFRWFLFTVAFPFFLFVWFDCAEYIFPGISFQITEKE